MTVRRCATAAVAVALSVLALASACTAPDAPGVASVGSPTSSAQASSPADADDRARQLASCLISHGVPAVTVEREGKLVAEVDKHRSDPALVAAAMTACAAYLPEPEPNKPIIAADLETRRLYARCIRDHGTPQFPDPDPQTGDYPMSEDMAAGLKSNPQFAEAMRACQNLQPGRDAPSQSAIAN